MKRSVLDIMKSVFLTDNIDETCSQINCEKWDSMNHLNLIVELEMEYNVSFEPEEIAMMVNYEKVLKVINRKIA